MIGEVDAIYMYIPEYSLIPGPADPSRKVQCFFSSEVFEVRLEERNRRINDVVPTIVRAKRMDHVRMRDLLDKAGVLGLNKVVIRASGMNETKKKKKILDIERTLTLCRPTNPFVNI